MPSRYLGLDLSMSSAGVAIIEVEERKPRLVTAFRIKTNAKLRHGLRLHEIARRLRSTLTEYEPFSAVIREKGFSRFAGATQAIFKVVGVSDLILRDYDIEELSPTTVKKTITGSGKAEKEKVEASVRQLLDLPSDYKFESDDASDACGVILTYLIEEGLIDGQTE